MNDIGGYTKSVRALLGGEKFDIDYYQREYRWQTKQIVDLIEDLTGKFLRNYEPGNERESIEAYGHYFLGSIVVSGANGKKFIIDGQQRLTSLTLLLIHIYHKLKDDDDRSQLAEIISSRKHGKRSFNLNVPERQECMQALFDGKEFDDERQSESITNILGRFDDIEEFFPTDDIDDVALPFFADWIIENVYLIELTAISAEDAYTIFQNMNNRGLSLTPTEMLKSYLLSNVKDASRRATLSQIWKDRIVSLQKFEKNDEADAIIAWLRSQYAKTIREHKRGAKPQDFDILGGDFYHWVFDNKKLLKLNSGVTFSDFIENDFVFYTSWYERIRSAAESSDDELECIYYNAKNQLTLQYPVLLAALRNTDSRADCIRKLRITAAYLEIMMARYTWNNKSTRYSNIQYGMFQTIRAIRGKAPDELASTLTTRLAEDKYTFDCNDDFHIHGGNRRQIHWLLARMTDFVETQSGKPSQYTKYIQRGSGDSYQIEHILARQPNRHQDEFGDAVEFLKYRNRIGGLLLLPRQFNASYGDMPYEEKRKYYARENMLAQSLDELAYDHNPGFLKFRERSGLPFQSHAEFQKADLDARQDLYRSLAKQIWNPDRLRQQVDM